MLRKEENDADKIYADLIVKACQRGVPGKFYTGEGNYTEFVDFFIQLVTIPSNARARFVPLIELPCASPTRVSTLISLQLQAIVHRS